MEVSIRMNLKAPAKMDANKSSHQKSSTDEVFVTLDVKPPRYITGCCSASSQTCGEPQQVHECFDFASAKEEIKVLKVKVDLWGCP